MAVDDTTNPQGLCCGNARAMCFDKKVMGQEEILERTYDAYGLSYDQY